MDSLATSKIPTRRDKRVILHFDYDCFYCAVHEVANPALRALPLAIQQKQIIVTCNYEARRRGLHKLQLITEAKKLCPDVIIILGEDISRFRDASKKLYSFLQAFSWNRKVERLGFDEVFLDVTDIVDHNLQLLNLRNLQDSFLQLSRKDPLEGFTFDARSICGPTFPKIENSNDFSNDQLFHRLVIGSHLARHIRRSLEEHHGYTSAVGISTSKLLSKLVGNVNKPNAQTTLAPPYSGPYVEECTPSRFMATFDIGAVPGVGFKMSNKLRKHILQREAKFDDGLVYGGTLEKVTVRDVRESPDMGIQLMKKVLSGPGMTRDAGSKVWGLLWGIDDIEVTQARQVPRQISIEDSYIRLDHEEQVRREFRMLSASLLKRMHADLLEDVVESVEEKKLVEALEEGGQKADVSKRWIAYPRTIRLSTRPRPPLRADGTRARSFARIFRSSPLPRFVFDLQLSSGEIQNRLVEEVLWPMFKKLHPEKSGWNLSLVNLAVTNMDEVGSSSAGSKSDIGALIRNQGDAGKEWRVEDKDVPPDWVREDVEETLDTEIVDQDAGLFGSQVEDEIGWDLSEYEFVCPSCGAQMPSFAATAHERFHRLG